MATTFTSSTLPSLYFDDFDKDDHYHQILFNSGRALQARELTQLQTLIYEELGRFGRNIFKEGAAVSSGGTAINANLDYVKIAATNSGGDFVDIPVGAIFQNPLTGVRAKVLRVEGNSTTFTSDTLYVQYINSGAATVSSSSTVFGDGETITSTNISGVTYELVTETPNATGKGVRFDVAEGDFFVLGRFVHTTAQSIMLSPYATSIDAEVGFKVTQEVVSVNDTNDLYDNAGGLVNTSSPGADRYRISLTLTTKADITDTDVFVFLANVENSKIVEETQTSDAYNKINDLLALRTNEESGDYIVNPFTVNINENSSDATKLDLHISAGTAYVNGYRVDNPSPIRLELPKPQETQTITNDVIPVVYGNYFVVDSCRALPDLTYGSVNISSSVSDPSGSILGTCRIRGVEEDGAQWRVYVFDVQVDSTSSLANARSIGTATTDRFTVVPEGTTTKLYGTVDNNLLMPTSHIRPSSFGTSSAVYTKQISTTVSIGGGTGTVAYSLGSGETFADLTLWMAAFTDGSSTFATITDVNSSGQVSIGVDGAYDVIGYVQVTTGNRKSKVSTDATSTLTLSTATDINGSTYNYYDFGIPDVYDIDSVRHTNSSGILMTNRVTLDDGQRDNFYADSRLILAQGDSAPAQISVAYKHFARSGSGDFYDASSYGNVTYDKIPTHTLQSGVEVELCNYVDFRPDKNDGTFSNIYPLPRNGSNIVNDVTFYLPRADKILVTQEGDFQVLMGQQGFNPQFKPTPQNSMELYRITLNPNTLDEDDLVSTSVEHKGYTMEDIGRLENRLDDLEQYTKLSILELQEQLRRLLDSDGNERAKIGIDVDDFADQFGADTNNGDYSASLDPENRLVRPRIDENNIRLIVDNSSSNNIVKKGDNVYLDYDSEQWAYQSLASRTVAINPFGMVDNVGVIKMSPTSDEWKESYEDAEKAVAGASGFSTRQAFLFNNWLWNWAGRTIDDCLKDANKRPKIFGIREAARKKCYVEKTLTSQSLRSSFNGRVVDVALIPWMRSRKVYFKAQGLTPNTKFTPFFDGVNVSSWCREEASFVQWADRSDDIGNQWRYSSLTAHPSGSSDLISDANGEIIGSFFIPNIRPVYYIDVFGKRRKKKTTYIRFRAGIREFKLLDINVNDWSAAGSKAFTHYSTLGAWNRNWKSYWSQRGWDYVLPWAWSGNLVSTYSGLELTNTLNAVTAGTVGLVSPQLAGKWGAQTSALTGTNLATLDANGEMSQVLSDYVNVNKNWYSGANVNPLSIPQNPMAQTFYVDNPYGVVLTKVNLYFGTKDSGNLPVSIHIRPVVDGKPSTNSIVQNSHVFLNPGQVTAIGENATLSSIQNKATVFEFDEPIFLQPWMNYAIVVTSQSTEYTIYSAKTKERVLGSTTRTVTSQPAPGSLFLPQNGMMWLESKDQDLMFKLTRAKFSLGGGSLVLKNASLPASLLDDNPIRTTSGSGKIYVSHMCHGLRAGDTALLDSCADINGITAATHINNQSLTVDSADLYGYTITTGGTATQTGYGGGSNVLSRRNAIFSIVNTQVDTMVPNFTSVDASAKFTSGTYISGSSTRFTKDTLYQRVSLGSNIDFAKPKAIYNSVVETAELGAGVSSTYVKLDMKTSNDYVSPIIDMQRASLILVGYCADNGTGHIYPVDETQPYGGSTGSKHITKPVTLNEPAVGMNINLQVNQPEGVAFDVYYRTADADENIYDQSWTLQAPTNVIPDDNGGDYQEVDILVGGQNGTSEPFNQYQLKVVQKAEDTMGGIKSLGVTTLAS